MFDSFYVVKTILERERVRLVLFTNFTPENIFALLLTGLDQNILTLLSRHLPAVLLGDVQADLPGHVLTDCGRHLGWNLSAHLLGNSLTLLLLDLNKQFLINFYGGKRFSTEERSDVISRGNDLTFV